ncbi:MAG: hypothetical protein ACRC8P_03735 [Spiroplasma sp.]
MLDSINENNVNSDIENIEVILKDFNYQKHNLIEQKYTSVISESQRHFKINKKVKINCDFNYVSPIIFKLLLSSLSKKLTIDDIKDKKVIKINNNNKIIYVFINEYIPNHLLKIEFIINKVLFEKTIILKAINNKKTLLIYQEKILGYKVIYGMLATIEKKRYIKLQLKMFDYQVFQLKYQLKLLSKRQMINYQKINARYQNKILRYQNFKFKST